MTTNPKKFAYHPLRKLTLIQPECPVYIYAYCLATQRDGDAAFAQVRLVNRSDKRVHCVFLRMEGKDLDGNSLYELQYVPLVECKGQPHGTFGEEQPLFLPRGDVHSLDIQVLDVLFEDGMIWRMQSEHELLTAEQAGWETCTCGMKNPGEAGFCAFCGKCLKVEEAPLSVEVAPSLVDEGTKEPEQDSSEPAEDTAAYELSEENPAIAATEDPFGYSGDAQDTVAEVAANLPAEGAWEDAADQVSNTVVSRSDETGNTEPSFGVCEEMPDRGAERPLADLIRELLKTPTAVAEEGAKTTDSEPEEMPEEKLLQEPVLVPRKDFSEEPLESYPDLPQTVTDDIEMYSEGELEPTGDWGPAIEDILGSGDQAATDDILWDMPEDIGCVPSSVPERGAALPVEEPLPEALPGSAEEPAPELSSVPWMEETDRMLQEFRRRMQALEQGTVIPTPAEEIACSEEAQPEASTKEASTGGTKGVMFWVLMVIFLIILGATAFFGVLYFKGYFG